MLDKEMPISIVLRPLKTGFIKVVVGSRKTKVGQNEMIYHPYVGYQTTFGLEAWLSLPLWVAKAL